MANTWGNNENSERLSFLGLQNHCRRWLQPWNYKILALWKKSCNKPRQCTKKQRHHFADKGLSCQSYGFSSSHVWMWELDHQEGWAPKNWCFWTTVLEKTLESPLDCKEIQTVHSKGDQSWVFFGAPKNKVWHCFHFSQSICYKVMGPDGMIFVFLMLRFKPAFSLSFFTLIKRLFNFS